MAQDNKATLSAGNTSSTQKANHPFKSTYARLFVEMGLKTLKPEANISDSIQNPNAGDISAARLIAAGSPMVISIKTSAKTLHTEFMKVKDGLMALQDSNLNQEIQNVEQYVKEALQAHEKLSSEVSEFNKERITQLKDAMANNSKPSEIKAKTAELNSKQDRLKKQTEELDRKISFTQDKVTKLKKDGISKATENNLPLSKSLTSS